MTTGSPSRFSDLDLLNVRKRTRSLRAPASKRCARIASPSDWRSAKRLVACSSPTGPAFEGAQISCGQRAAPGAIERVRIDRDTLEPRVKVIGCDLWSDEPGFDDALPEGIVRARGSLRCATCGL